MDKPKSQSPSKQEPVFKEYETPNGKVSLTKAEFNEIVEMFRRLKNWRNEKKAS